MTPEEIDELERLMTAATPGPWRDEREPPPTRNRWFETHDGAPIESRGTHFALGVAVGVTAEPRDAAAIVALHNAAPALIKAAREVERLRAFVPRWVDTTVTRSNDPAWVTPMRVYDLKVGTSSVFTSTIVVHTDGTAYEGAGERHPNIESAARAVCARLGIPDVEVPS